MRPLQLRLAEAIIRAAVVTMPSELRAKLGSDNAFTRTVAEEQLTNRIMEPLRECAAASAREGQQSAKDR